MRETESTMANFSSGPRTVDSKNAMEVCPRTLIWTALRSYLKNHDRKPCEAFEVDIQGFGEWCLDPG